MVRQPLRPAPRGQQCRYPAVRCAVGGSRLEQSTPDLQLGAGDDVAENPGRNRRPRGHPSGLAEYGRCMMETAVAVAAEPLACLSIVIPARDEEGCIRSTVEHLHLELSLHNVPHEIVVVDDGSQDSTWQILTGLCEHIPELHPVQNTGAHGFGRAIIRGLDSMQGDCVVIMMADKSDDCRDVVTYWQTLNQGYDCVFGRRFIRRGGRIDYPRFKMIMNRIVNTMVRIAFNIKLNDTTNA